MRKLRSENGIVLFLLCLAIFLSFPVCDLSAEEVIDPEEYVLTMGRIESLEGTAVIVRESGKEQLLNTGDLIISEKVVEYIENIDDRDFVNDGYKKIEESFVLKTGPDSEVKIALEDFQQNSGVLTIREETEIEVICRGGCVYASDYDCEGFDYDTLRWRHKNKNIDLKIIEGKIRAAYVPDENYSLNVKSENFYNYFLRTEDNSLLDFEVEVKAEKNSGVSGSTDLAPDFASEQMKEAIKNTKEMMLEAYNAESFEELDEDIKAEIEAQIAAMEAMLSETDAEVTENEEPSPSLYGDLLGNSITTIVRVYENQLQFRNSVIKSGEMAVIKSGPGVESFEIEQF